MKGLAFCVGFGISLISLGQGAWTDSFTDQKFGRNPTWTGDTLFFTHSPNLELQLSDSVAGTREIRTRSTAILNAIWRGKIRMEFNPSSNNYAIIRLAADSLGNSVFLQFGGQADDLVQLNALYNGALHSIVSTPPDFLDWAQNDLEWIVTYDSVSQWTLQLDLNQSGMTTIGQQVDTIVFHSNWYSIECYFSKTRADKFYWDDLSVIGTPYQDSIPPAVARYQWLNRNELMIDFTESMVFSPHVVEDHRAMRWNVTQKGQQQFLFSSITHAVDGVYTFDLEEFKDAFGNSSGLLKARLSRPSYGDIVVNELMIDPSPPVNYPFEYIEIKNPTPKTIQLEQLSIWINNTEKVLKPFELQAYQRLVLMEDTHALKDPVLKAPLPGLSLNNQEGRITVIDDWNEVLFQISYSSDWHNSEWKSNGGWSISRNETMPSCAREEAWSTSSSEFGGTPGTTNHPIPKEYSPVNDLLYIEITDSNYLLHFSTPLDELHLYEQDDHRSCIPKNQEKLTWYAEINPLSRFQLSGRTCMGEFIDSAGLQIGHLTSPSFGSLRITEILSNPSNDNSEFLEIANLSDSCLDLSQIRIARWSESGGREELFAIVEKPVLLQPQEILLLSENPEKVIQFYPYSNGRSIVKHSYFPNLAQQGGIALFTANGSLIDAVEWSSLDHHATLSSTTDVSLERIDFSLGNHTMQSSPSSTNHGSPGIFKLPYTDISELISSESFRFSPNNDGFEDLLILNLPNNWKGGVLQMVIYNSSGQKIAEPETHFLIGQSPQLHWNGTDDLGRILPSGQYMIEIKASPINGKSITWRHGCLLTNS